MQLSSKLLLKFEKQTIWNFSKKCCSLIAIRRTLNSEFKIDVKYWCSARLLSKQDWIWLLLEVSFISFFLEGKPLDLITSGPHDLIISGFIIRLYNHVCFITRVSIIVFLASLSILRTISFRVLKKRNVDFFLKSMKTIKLLLKVH